MEGFIGGGSFGEGKGDGGLYCGILKLWWNKWRRRRKKMMTRCCRSCCCCYCSEDERRNWGF